MSASDSQQLPLIGTSPSRERIFPALTDAQVARIAARGSRRTITPGEVLVNAGDRAVPFFVVVSGALQVFDAAGKRHRHARTR
jgi:CRP-like cAMP-binding protein